MDIIIVAPSLDTSINVSGVSSVANFIIQNNPSHQYLHFQQGKGDAESGHIVSRAFRICRAYYRWKQYLKSHPDSLIHYNFPLDAPSVLRDFWFMAYAFRKNHRMIIHIHGGLYLFETKRPWIINQFLRKIFQWNLPIIVQSDKEKTVLTKDFHASKVSMLANCIDTKTAETYKRDNSHSTPLEIIYLGRIEPNKGIDDILTASEKLKSHGIDFRLHLAGKEQKNDNYIPRFEKALGPQFKYEGIVSGKVKEELMRKCHVFLLPSLYEGLPMSLLECMSYGIVPITTNVGSIDSVVRDGENGFFVPLKSAEHIANTISRINSDREKMREMSNCARETILRKFSPKQYITTLNQIYDSCLPS